MNNKTKQVGVSAYPEAVAIALVSLAVSGVGVAIASMGILFL